MGGGKEEREKVGESEEADARERAREQLGGGGRERGGLFKILVDVWPLRGHGRQMEDFWGNNGGWTRTPSSRHVRFLPVIFHFSLFGHAVCILQYFIHDLH